MAIFHRFRNAGCYLVAVTPSSRISQFLTLVIALLIPTTLMAGCTRNSSAITQTVTATATVMVIPKLLVEKEPSDMYLTALYTGPLGIGDDGYISMGDTLIIWPYGYSLQVKDNTVMVIDGKGHEFARVGDAINLRGGFVPTSVGNEKLGYFLSAGITGFWLAAPDYLP